jgi:hypothetical protein
MHQRTAVFAQINIFLQFGLFKIHFKRYLSREFCKARNFVVKFYTLWMEINT